jgi:hypothetical protein
LRCHLRFTRVALTLGAFLINSRRHYSFGEEP